MKKKALIIGVCIITIVVMFIVFYIKSHYTKTGSEESLLPVEYNKSIEEIEENQEEQEKIEQISREFRLYCKY